MQLTERKEYNIVVQEVINITIKDIEREKKIIENKLAAAIDLVNLYNNLLEINQENYKIWKAKDIERAWAKCGA